MNRSCKNVYKRARDIAGLTREYASELLHVSPRTLAYYESDNEDFKRPHGEIVDKMVEIYKTEWLAYMHGVYATKTGRRAIPPISEIDFARGVLTLQSHIDTVQSKNSSLIRIAMNGTVEENKQKEWESLKEDIAKLAGAAMTLVIGGYEKSPMELELQRA